MFTFRESDSSLLPFNDNLTNPASYLAPLQMLRTMKGYDEYNTILLPPRQPGEKLPQEVTDAFNEQQRQKEAADKEKAEAAAAEAAAQAEKAGEKAGEVAGAPPVIATVPPSTSGEGGRAGSDTGDGAKDGKEGNMQSDSYSMSLLLIDMGGYLEIFSWSMLPSSTNPNPIPDHST